MIPIDFNAVRQAVGGETPSPISGLINTKHGEEHRKDQMYERRRIARVIDKELSDLRRQQRSMEIIDYGHEASFHAAERERGARLAHKLDEQKQVAHQQLKLNVHFNAQDVKQRQRLNTVGQDNTRATNRIGIQHHWEQVQSGVRLPTAGAQIPDWVSLPSASPWTGPTAKPPQGSTTTPAATPAAGPTTPPVTTRTSNVNPATPPGPKSTGRASRVKKQPAAAQPSTAQPAGGNVMVWPPAGSVALPATASAGQQPTPGGVRVWPPPGSTAPGSASPATAAPSTATATPPDPTAAPPPVKPKRAPRQSPSRTKGTTP